MIIGNATNDAQVRTTQTGINVCTFTVAVNNRKRRDGEEEQTDFFKVTAWRGLADICGKFVQKGKKVCVIGDVHLKNYTGNDGSERYNMEVTAQDIEFLSAREQRGDADDTGLTYTPPADKAGGFTAVEADDLPF